MYTVTLALVLIGAEAQDSPKSTSAKDALQPFNVLVGSWKGAGAPEGTKEERAAGAWTETIEWVWKFKDQDAWLTVAFEKSKYFTKGELRYTPDKDQKTAEPRFTLTLLAPDKSSMAYTGTLKEKVLTLDRGRRTGRRATATQSAYTTTATFIAWRRDHLGRLSRSAASFKSERPRRVYRSPMCRRDQSASSAAGWGRSR